jgi:hypothetical protein
MTGITKDSNVKNDITDITLIKFIHSQEMQNLSSCTLKYLIDNMDTIQTYLSQTSSQFEQQSYINYVSELVSDLAHRGLLKEISPEHYKLTKKGNKYHLNWAFFKEIVELNDMKKTGAKFVKAYQIGHKINEKTVKSFLLSRTKNEWISVKSIREDMKEVKEFCEIIKRIVTRIMGFPTEKYFEVNFDTSELKRVLLRGFKYRLDAILEQHLSNLVTIDFLKRKENKYKIPINVYHHHKRGSK